MARRKLTPKQERFALLYVELSNASEAYRQAGYTARSAHAAEVGGSKLLRNAEVAKRIDEIMEKASKKEEVTRERIISRLAEFAWPKEGVEVKDRDSIKALELLGKRFALWIERHQQDGPGWEDVFKKLSPETQMRIVEELESIEVPDVGAIH